MLVLVASLGGLALFGSQRSAVLGPSVGAPAAVIGSLTATPPVVRAGQPSTIEFALGTGDPNLIPGGVNLIRLTGSGTQSAIIGQLYDDGTHGDALAADKVYTLRAVFTEAAPGEFRVQASAAFRGVLKRVLTAPVTISVWREYTHADVPITFARPQLADVPHAIDVLPSGVIALNVTVPSSTATVPALFVSVVDNSRRLSLAQWFSEYVDSSGRLIESGAYELISLPDGTQVFTEVGGLPVDWTGGPQASSYVMAPDNSRVAVLQISPDNPLSSYGVSPDSFSQMTGLITQSIRFR